MTEAHAAATVPGDPSGASGRDHVAQQCLMAAKILCGVTLVFPALTLAGWIVDVPLIVRGHALWPALPAATAAGLAVAAVAVRATPAGPSSVTRTSLALALASPVLLLGLITLFSERPSPVTSLNFALLGTAIVSFTLGGRLLSIGHGCAIAVAATALVTVTGHLFNTRALSGLPARTAPIVPGIVSVAFLLLAAALFCRRPTAGMMALATSDTHSGRMARRLLVAGIVALPLIGGLSRLGVTDGWYDVAAQGPVFVLVIAGILLLTIWQTARGSDDEERAARAALLALERSNAALSRTVDDRQAFAALVENSSDFIGIADTTGTAVYVNPAGRRMVGLKPGFPIENTTILDYYPPDQRAFAAETIVKATTEHGHWEGETVFRHWRNGTTIPVSDAHFIIRSADSGQTLGIGTITRDISEARRAREEIEHSNRRLAQANDTVSLLNGKLTTLAAAKTRFFANISHELRTPLALILGPLEKHLRDNPSLDVGLRRDLEVAQRNARTVLRHVNDLLDVARLEAGRAPAEYSETDAAALVRLAIDHFSALAADQHIALDVEVPPALPVQTDSDKLQRIVLNLLSNAFKFTPAGGRVRVSLHAAAAEFRVEVGDTGPGIPADKRTAVFERFVQLDDGAARRRTGTGLGLSIVWDLAVLLGGTVAIGDAPEGGALFIVRLPSEAPAGTVVRQRPAEPMDAAVAEQLVDELRAGRRTAPTDRVVADAVGRVLVIEDDRDMAGFIGDCLRSEGFDVAAAFDGEEGYDKATTEQPDVVLIDIMLPKMSGDELVRRLRQRPELHSTPIVVLTSKADEELRVELLSEGVQDYLDKPFSVAELRARVRNLIARKRVEDHLSSLRRQLEAVAVASSEISQAVASLPAQSVQTVFETIARNAQELTGATYAAAAIGGDATHPFEVWAVVGANPDQIAAVGHPPRPVGLLGLVARENRVVRLHDVREHPAFRGFPLHHPEMRSFLGVPIRYHGHAVGNLYLANKRGGAPFTNEDQQIVELLAARAGIAIETARMYAAEGQAHAWLQAVIDQMPDGVILVDSRGHVTMENQSLRALTNGRAPAPDRYGSPMTIDLRQPSGEPVAHDDLPIVKAMATRSTIRGHELLGRRSDDSVVPLLVSAAPIFTGAATVAGAVMVVQDITSLKELEHLREEWASIVAHDLRQPISVISLRSSLLLRPGAREVRREDIRQIRAAAESLSRMVSDLMDASLLDTRRMRVKLERLDLRQLMEDVVERVPLAAQRTRLRMPPGTGPFIRADSQRLEQVVANLLSNAVKYGSPNTEIGLEVRRADGSAEIIVTNRGPGIPADELPLIFERYARLRAVRAGATKGLGLGLDIAKGLVEAHAGRIWAESAPDGVTAFHVSLPIDGPPASADAIESAAAGAAPVERQAERA